MSPGQALSFSNARLNQVRGSWTRAASIHQQHFDPAKVQVSASLPYRLRSRSESGVKVEKMM